MVPKKTRNPAATRSLILGKATEIFARSGFEGTSINDVVTATGVNKRMIYHYFGDKRGLYRTIALSQWMELKEWVDRTIAERLLGRDESPADTRELLVAVLGIFYDFMAGHQVFVRLMMWDGLEGGEISRDLWGEVRGPLFRQATALLAQAQRDGTLDPALDPGHLIISFLGVTGFHFAYASSLGDLIGKDPLSAGAVAERREQVIKLLESCLR